MYETFLDPNWHAVREAKADGKASSANSTRPAGSRFEGLDRVMGGTAQRHRAAQRLADEAGHGEQFATASREMRDGGDFGQFLDATLKHFGRADLAGGLEATRAERKAAPKASVSPGSGTKPAARAEPAAAPKAAAYVPPAPSAAEIAARKAREAREKAIAAEAAAQKRRAAVDAMWDRAARANGHEPLAALPCAKAIDADKSLTDEQRRQAKADAVWDRAHAQLDRDRSHLR